MALMTTGWRWTTIATLVASTACNGDDIPIVPDTDSLGDAEIDDGVDLDIDADFDTFDDEADFDVDDADVDSDVDIDADSDVDVDTGPIGPDSDCCTESFESLPGCMDPFCEEQVCAEDPFCCQSQWDVVCADLAVDVCFGLCGSATTATDTGEPPDSDCCTPSMAELPGCTDPECEQVVCTDDPFCCESVWDVVCTDLAQESCPLCTGATDTGPLTSTTGDTGSTSDTSDTGSTSDTGDTGSTSDTDTTGDTGSTGDTGTTGGDPLDAFETPQPFGDNVTETDLIGIWYLPTDGSAPGYSMSLDIDIAGNFIWTELDGSCNLVREGTGVLWVAGAQLVMLFETFTGSAPWPVMSQFGWDADAPFLIRAGYAPVLGHIAVTVTPEMRIATPWSSYGYARTIGGTTADDTWIAETELWDVPPGETTAEIVARDRYTLAISSGSATRTYNRWWYDSGIQSAEPAVVDNPVISDDGLGHLDLAGSAYVYVGNRMASYDPGDNFQLNAATACP